MMLNVDVLLSKSSGCTSKIKDDDAKFSCRYGGGTLFHSVTCV